MTETAAAREDAHLAEVILSSARLCVSRRMAGPAADPGRFAALCRDEVGGMLRWLEDGDPAAAAAVSAVIDAAGRRAAFGPPLPPIAGRRARPGRP